MTQYTIQITPSNQTWNTPVSCISNNSVGLLTFAPSDWDDLKIKDGDEVSWVWSPSGPINTWGPDTSLAFLLITGAQLCPDDTNDNDCENLPSPQGLKGYIRVTIGTFYRNKNLPQPASSCQNFGGRMSYVTADSNQVGIQGNHSIPTGKYLKLTYTIWFTTSDFNYQQSVDASWFYDPEIDVLPAEGQKSQS